MQLNEYNLYSLNTQVKIQDSKDKIFDDIKNMDNILEYYDILEFIENNYGQVENHFEQEFSDDIKLNVEVMTNLVQIIVSQKDKMLFGKRWIFNPEEEPEIEGNIKFIQPEIKSD